MSFLDSLKKALKPETFAAMLEEAGDDFDFTVVPYARFQKVIKERNSLREELAEAASAGGAGDPDKKFTQKDVDDAVTKAVTAKETELQTSFTTQLNDLKVRDAALSKLREAGALDAELMYDSAKFDKSTLKFNDKGELEGIDAVVKTWQKDHASLFGEVVPSGTGKSGGKDPGRAKQGLDNALDSIFGITPMVSTETSDPVYTI